MGEQLRLVKNENSALREHLKTQSGNHKRWFPLFDAYKDSLMRATLSKLPQVQASHQTAEARIAADYKRLLAALPVEGRRRVGFFVSSLLGLRGNQQNAAAETVDT